jgi:hypothetical protein
MAKAARKKSVVTVDFSGVDMSGGRGFHIPEGEYKMKVKSAEKDKSKNDNDMIVWQFLGLEGKSKNKTFYYYTPLTEESLWKLGLTLKALGEEVEDSAMDIDLEDMVDRECTGVVIDDEYNGKTQSKLQSVESLEDAGEDDGENDKKSSSSAKKGKGKVTKLEPDEVKEMTEDELEELNEKHNLEVDLADHKTLRRKAAAIVAALEENDLLAA